MVRAAFCPTGSQRIGQVTLGLGCWCYLSDPGVPGRASVGPSWHSYWWWRPQYWNHRWLWLFLRNCGQWSFLSHHNLGSGSWKQGRDQRSGGRTRAWSCSAAFPTPNSPNPPNLCSELEVWAGEEARPWWRCSSAEFLNTPQLSQPAKLPW